MKPDEYEIMFRVEDSHWWYAGLRGLLAAFWGRCVAGSGEHAIRVLDVGCGTGATLGRVSGFGFRVSGLGPEGVVVSRPKSDTRNPKPETRNPPSVVGVDFSLEAIRFCRKRGLDATAAASAVALPFPRECFDVAVSCDVLCHQSIADKQAPLREIHRVLKPGGVVMLNLPAYQWLYSSHDVHVQTDHRFTRREALGLLDACSFEPVASTYWNTLLFPAILATRLWRKMRPLAHSDLEHPPGGILNRLLLAVLDVERALIRVAPLPFGLSVFVVARKG